MAHPDDFSAAASGCFPSIGDLHSEMRGRKAVRLGAALGRIDSAMDELIYRIGGLASEGDNPSEDDMEDAERVADALEIALERTAIGTPRAVRL